MKLIFIWTLAEVMFRVLELIQPHYLGVIRADVNTLNVGEGAAWR